MSNGRNELYEFGRFSLDVGERRFEAVSGEPACQIPEKVFQTLVHLVRNHGKLISKQHLLEAVWPDTAVEENNLDKAIYSLRQILGEKTGGPKYIETVRKHGYRFVAEVRKGTTDEPLRLVEVNAPATLSVSFAGKGVPTTPSGAHSVRLAIAAEPVNDTVVSFPVADGSQNGVERNGLHQVVVPPTAQRSPRYVVFAVVAAAVFALAAGGLAMWTLVGRHQAGPAEPVLSSRFSAENLSSGGKVFVPAISPSGKLVAFSNSNPDDTSSVWLRNLETGHSREIIPPAVGTYLGLEFSPDGDTLYYVRRPRNQSIEWTELYRLSIHGGIPVKVASETQGWISISPIGDKIAFVRCQKSKEDFCSLFVADAADGGNERKLVTRERPQWIRDVDFSPDGNLIAFASGQSENSGMDFGLSAVDIASGEVRELSPDRFFNITGIAWLPDTSLLITASKIPVRNFRLWRVKADTGRAEPVTDGMVSYSGLSVDRTGSILVTSKTEDNFRARVLDLPGASEILVVPRASMVNFADNRGFCYSSSVTGNREIWCVDSDGNGARQLTNDPADDLHPIIGRDAFYFSSNRSGSVHVWRMNVDGSNPTQVTSKNGGFAFALSPDGEWVYYHHGLDRTLWRLSVRTGEERIIVATAKTDFAISRDSTRAAYSDRTGIEKFIQIVSLPDGQKIGQLRIADQEGTSSHIAWLPDGNAIAYFVSDNEFRRHTMFLHPFDSSRSPQKIVEINEQMNEAGGFTIAPDGKAFAISQGDWHHDAVLLRGIE